MSDFDLGYRSPLLARLEEKDDKIARLNETITMLQGDIAMLQRALNVQAEIVAQSNL
jgi:peptidoglycan hydrolase CwlO-like protein